MTYEEQVESAGYLRADLQDYVDTTGKEAAGGPFYFNVYIEDFGNGNIRIFFLYG